MCEPKPADVAKINGCDHLFCFDCIERWAERENTCPLCKVRFSKIERVQKKRKSGAEKLKNSKRVKQKDQRSDLGSGAGLEGLLERVASNHSFPSPHQTFARLIFASIDSGTPFSHPNANYRSMLVRGGIPVEGTFESDTDDDDEGETFLRSVRAGHSLSLLRRNIAIPGRVLVGGSMPVLRQVPFSRAAVPASRSYASNGSDLNAGRRAENPLHICDSDDEGDGDEAEVVVTHVSRPPY